MSFKYLSSISLAAITTALSISAFAQGGNDPIPGVDIIIKRDPSSQPIKPFSMTPDEIAQLNKIKGVGRMELILKAAAKRADVQDGFVKSGMSVMGKDWCGECPWPERARYEFKNGETVYVMDLAFQTQSKKESEMGRSIPAGKGGQTNQLQMQKMDAVGYGSTRSNKQIGEGIKAPVSCVTVDGAVDADCNGVDDAKQEKADFVGDRRVRIGLRYNY